MKSWRLPVWLLMGLACAIGCSPFSSGRMSAIETQNRALIEQNKAQAAEIENLREHSRRLEDRLLARESNEESSSSGVR